MPKPNNSQVVPYDVILTNEIHHINPLPAPAPIQMQIPAYQRELAWDFETKMLPLWKDIFLHLQTTHNVVDDPFFLGNITINYHQNDFQLVDGQQRLTTLHVICAGIRDALVCTGYQEDAYALQDTLLSKDRGDNPRILPLDNPTIAPPLSDSLSSRKKLDPYHKLIVPVKTGCIVDGGPAGGLARHRANSGCTTINIQNSQYEWSASQNTRKILIRRGDKFLGEVHDWVMSNYMEHSQNTGTSINLASPLTVDLEDGDEIWLKEESLWWHKFEDAVDDKYNPDKNTMFAPHFRKLYVRVRGDVEHYIMDEKSFRNFGAKTIDNTLVSPNLKYSWWQFDPVDTLQSSMIHFEGATVEIFDDVGVHRQDTMLLGEYDPAPGSPGIDSKLDMKVHNGKSKKKPQYFDRFGDRLKLIGCRPETIPRFERNWTITIPFLNQITPLRNNPVDRKNAVKDLITKVTFVSVTFSGSPDDAIDYFLDVNDPAKHSPLQTYDLVNGLVEKIVSTGAPFAPGSDGALLVSAWSEVKKDIYQHHDKDPSVSQNFFYSYLMASKCWKSSSERYEAHQSFEGLKRSWEESGSFRTATGAYNLAYLKTQFEQMAKYAKIFCYVQAPQLLDCALPGGMGVASGALRAKRKRKQYLFILRNLDEKQWIAAYMALAYKLEEKGINKREEHLRDFLYDYLVLFFKYGGLWKKILPKTNSATPNKCILCAGGASEHQGSLYGSNALYGLFVGTNKFIDKVHTTISGKVTGSSLTAGERASLINHLRTATIFNGGGAPPGTRDFYAPGDAHLKSIQRSINKGLLMAFESTLLGNGDPEHWHKVEIEHILPESPSRWGAQWYGPGAAGRNGVTWLHKTHVQLMGNKLLLEKEINRHVSNHTLAEKRSKHDCHANHHKNPYSCPCGILPVHVVCGAEHYEQSNMNCVTSHTAAYTTWNDTDIDDRTEAMMTAVINAFNGY